MNDKSTQTQRLHTVTAQGAKTFTLPQRAGLRADHGSASVNVLYNTESPASDDERSMTQHVWENSNTE